MGGADGAGTGWAGWRGLDGAGWMAGGLGVDGGQEGCMEAGLEGAG